MKKRYFFFCFMFCMSKVLQAQVCTTPINGGTSAILPTPVCNGANFILTLLGNSTGTNQIYDWESSSFQAGPYTSLMMPGTSPTIIVSATSNLWYRCAITCNSTTVYSPDIQVILTPQNPGGTFTINSAVPTSGNNFQTFADAISSINCGISGPVVFNVVPGSGPYNEQINLSSIIAATATNPLTINGNGATLTYAATASGSPYTMLLNGADYVTVNDLNIVATGTTYANACHLYNNADNNTFNNCTFTSPTTGTATTMSPFSISGSASGLTTSGSTGNNNIVNNCTMIGGYYSAIFYGSTSGANTGNQLINCTLRDFYAFGIYTYYQNGMIISGNVVERPTRSAVITTSYGIYVFTGSVGTLVEKNRIRNLFGGVPTSTNTAYAIYSSIDGTLGNENKYYNNLIYDMNGNGPLGGLYLTGADYIKVYHNTVSLDNTASTATGLTHGIYSTGTVGGMDIKNNIVTITRGGTGTKYCLYYTGGTQQSNNNDLYISAGGTANYVGFYTSTSHSSLTTWKTANGGVWDQASWSLNPTYTNPASGDFKPTNTSLAMLGTPVGIMTDITNFSRSVTTPDLGSYEFSNPLNIKLGEMSATNINQRNRIDWATLNEDEGDHFELERSEDGLKFTRLAGIEGSGKSSSYRYWDEYPFKGINHYRLKILDKTRNFSYSKNMTATVSEKQPVVIEAFPNPFGDELIIKLNIAHGDNGTITIADVAGNTIMMSSVSDNKIVIDMRGVAQGVYLVKYADSKQSHIIKVTKQ